MTQKQIDYRMQEFFNEWKAGNLTAHEYHGLVTALAVELRKGQMPNPFDPVETRPRPKNKVKRSR